MATDVHRWTCDIYFIASLLCEWVCLRDGECFLKKKGCGTKSNKSNILDILFVESSKPFMSLISAFVIFLI